MTHFRSSRYARRMAIALIAALYLLPAAGTTLMAAQPVAARQTLVVFPFEMTADKTGSAAQDTLGADFANALKSSLAGSSAYIVMAYNERLPSVVRGVNDALLKKEDVAGPFGPDKDQRDRALRVASAMSADVALVGSIDEYKYDAAKKQFVVTVTAEMVAVNSGKTIKLFTGTGRSPENSAITDQDQLAALAAGDAAAKTAAEVVPQGTVATPGAPGQPAQLVAVVEQPRKKSWFKKLLIPIALGLAVGIAASGHGSSGGGDITPPPDL